MRRDPQAETVARSLQIMGGTRHFSIRRAAGQAHEFCSDLDSPPLVTLADARRLLNLGRIHMERLVEIDGWQYVTGSIHRYNHVGEHHAALATFDSIHRDPATRHRYGQYLPAPVIIDDTTVVSVWQDHGRSVQTTSHPRKK